MRNAFSLLIFLPTFLIISGNILRAEIYTQVSIPPFHKQSLLNGMQVQFFPSSDSRLPFVLMIKNGAAFDPLKKWGVTYLTARMALEGTKNAAGSVIRDDLQERGVELGFRVDWDAIFFFGTAPIEQLNDTLGGLAEIVVRPRFDEEIFQRVQAQIMNELEQEVEHIETMTEALFVSKLFEGNAYQHPVKGTPSSVKNLELTDVKIQYRRLFMPNQSQLALYFTGSRDTLFTMLGRRWGSWIRGKPAPFTFRKAPALKEGHILLINRPSTESLFRWGKLGVEKGTQEYYVFKVFEQYLTLSLPEWATQVAAENQIKALAKVRARKMPGYFQFSLQAPTGQLISYLQRFYDFLADLQEGRIDSHKLEEARQLTFLEFRSSFDQPLSRLYGLLETDLYDLGISYVTNYGVRISRVTEKTLQNILQRHLFQQDFLMVVAGPAEILQSPLEEFGKVEVLSLPVALLN